MDVDVAVLALVRLAPDGAQQPTLRDEAAHVGEQDAQDLELARRQVDPLAVDARPRGGRCRASSEPTDDPPVASAAGPAACRRATEAVRSARRRRTAWSRSRRHPVRAPRPSRAPRSDRRGSRSASSRRADPADHAQAVDVRQARGRAGRCRAGGVSQRFERRAPVRRLVDVGSRARRARERSRDASLRRPPRPAPSAPLAADVARPSCPGLDRDRRR